MRARVTIVLKPTVLDAQGATVERALQRLGFEGVSGLRIGKHVEFTLPDGDPRAARAQVEEMCRKLLANPVIEEYTIEVMEE